MKIKLVSDLHTEWHRDQGKSFIQSLDTDNANVLVVAGDLTGYTFLEDNLTRLCDKFPEVVYVAGNHEYYGSDFQTVNNILRQLQSSIYNFNWLNDGAVEIDGQRFIGSTLWYKRSPTSEANKRMLADFRLIANCDPEVFDRFENTVSYFEKFMKSSDIVITHHMPSQACVNPKYANSPANCYFASNLDSIILDKQPKLWLHGHTHSALDIELGETRIVCNPFGIDFEINDFDENLIIEVDRIKQT